MSVLIRFFITALIVSMSFGGCTNTDDAIAQSKHKNSIKADTTVVNKSRYIKPPYVYDSLKVAGNAAFRYEPYEDPPEIIYLIRAQYPELERPVYGTVVLEVSVSKLGKIVKVDVLRSLLPGKNGLDMAAVAAVKQWKFLPGKSHGRNIDTKVTIPYEFEEKDYPVRR